MWEFLCLRLKWILTQTFPWKRTWSIPLFFFAVTAFVRFLCAKWSQEWIPDDIISIYCVGLWSYIWQNFGLFPLLKRIACWLLLVVELNCILFNILGWGIFSIVDSRITVFCGRYIKNVNTFLPKMVKTNNKKQQ